MSLTSVWAKWEEWNSAFRTWFPHVKFCSPHGDQLKWYLGKGHFECQLCFPGQTPLDLVRNTEMVNLLRGKDSWLHGRGSMQWPNGIVGGNIHGWNMVKHGETAGAGGNENMKGVGIVWVGTRDVYASGWKTARVVVLLFPESACEGFFVKKQPFILHLHTFTPADLDLHTFTPADLDLHTFTPADLDLHTFTPADLDLHTFTPADLDLHTFTPADLDLHTFTPADLDLHTFTPADLDLHTFTPADLDLHTLTSADLDLHTLTSADLDLHTLTSADLDLHTLTPADLDLHTLTPADLDLHIRTPADLDLHTLTSADLHHHTLTPADLDLHTLTPADLDLHTFTSADLLSLFFYSLLRRGRCRRSATKRNSFGQNGRWTSKT